MAKPIQMPKLSDEMTEGKLARWLKKEGEEVGPGDVVAQVETEKATLDVEAFDAGVLIGIAVREGETVPVGTPIAWVGARGEEAPKQPEGRPAPAVPAPAAGPAAGPKSAPQPLPTRGAREAPRAAVAREARAGGRAVASPAARKAARERGIDLAAVAGSGPGGRVVLSDLERVPAPPSLPSRLGLERPGEGRPRRELPPRAALREERIPLSPMRKAIVRNLAQAKPGAPHFYLELSADMRRLLALRDEFDELGEGQVSVNDLLVKAAADALTRHPEVNAAWAGDRIERRAGVDVGVAVAIEDGLMTPVVHGADRLSIFELSRLTRELAKRAREKRLRPEEYQGASFTVSNLGMFGVEAFYAIVNSPEAAILSVGAVQKVPWVDAASGALVAVERCRFGLSGDHRVIDGATGARFLQTFQGTIESPMRLFVG